MNVNCYLTKDGFNNPLNYAPEFNTNTDRPIIGGKMIRCIDAQSFPAKFKNYTVLDVKDSIPVANGYPATALALVEEIV